VKAPRVLFLVLLVGCASSNESRPAPAPTVQAMPMPPQPAPNAYAAQGNAYEEQMDKLQDDQFDRREQALSRALRVTLGLEAIGPSAPQPASAHVKALRAAGLVVRIEPATDAQGNAFGENMVRLNNVLADHAAHGGLTDADKRAIQKNPQAMLRVSGLADQVALASSVTFDTNSSVQFLSLATMGRVSRILSGRPPSALSEAETTTLKGRVARVRRAEAAAATSLGLLATYEAVVNDGRDPKALDAFAEQTSKSFPMTPDVTDDDVKAYVAALPANPSEMMARYDAVMRNAMGPGGRQIVDGMKAQLDAAYAQARTAPPQAYAPPPAYAAPSAYPPPAPAPGPPVAGRAPPGMVGQVGQGYAAATAAANGNLPQALDSAANMFPPDGTVASSLRGVAAISRGDAKGAIDSALKLVPGGGLVKDALSFASGLLFGGKKGR
jgi:hypothetical protein